MQILKFRKKATGEIYEGFYYCGNFDAAMKFLRRRYRHDIQVIWLDVRTAVLHYRIHLSGDPDYGRFFNIKMSEHTYCGFWLMVHPSGDVFYEYGVSELTDDFEECR